MSKETQVTPATHALAASFLRDRDSTRTLAWLPAEAMVVDLADPEQRRFGDYELIERIGEGGMGVVYRARQRGLERDVAIKLLAAGPGASPAFVERFRREARSAARMQHPNIVEIYEFGRRGELDFFSMRLIEGRSLAQKLAAEGPMAPKDAARLLRTLAEAVDYAHRLGVLHLDLKPANVLLDANGTPLIADFGLARHIDAEHEGNEISGTPSYMAPEQARGEPTTAATDIYGLGAVLYECLTGRAPFLGADAQAVLERVVIEAPAPPRQLRRDVPRDLEAVCLKCLGKDPAMRYAAARGLADDLGLFVEGRAVHARPLQDYQRLAHWVRREPRLAGAVGLAVLALASGTVATTLLWRRAERALESAHFFEFATLLPGAESGDLRELHDQVYVQLSPERIERIHGSLAASSDPEVLLTAGLVGKGLWRPEKQVGGEQIRRAVEARPADAFVLIAAIRNCNPFDCPVPDAPARLARLQPDNLLGWEGLIDPPQAGFDTLEARQRRLMDPSIRAEMRALVAQASRATRWDARLASFARRRADALDAKYVRLPRMRPRSDEFSDETSDASWRFRFNWFWHAGAAARHWMLDEYCAPPSVADDAGLRTDCLRIAQVLVAQESSEHDFRRGVRMIHRLAPGTALETDALARARRAGWVHAHDLWNRERHPIEAGEVFLRDWEQFGEMEALRRQLDRHRIAREPPADWEPAHRPDWLDTP
jgi:predicted Ser/Thr protein kinase